MMPLALAPPGGRVRIAAIRAGKGLAMRLLHMGLKVGDVVEVVANNSPGPVIVAKGGMRLGLGFGIAHRIFVVPASGPEAFSSP